MKRNKKINLKRGLRKARVRAKIFGTAQKPRASVFRSNKFIYLQLIDDQKQHTLAAATAKKTIKAATALGERIAELAKKNGIKGVIFDRGSYKYHGQVAALAEAMRKSGIEF